METKAKNIQEMEDDFNNDLLHSRSSLVHVRHIVDSSIFGGWGVKI